MLLRASFIIALLVVGLGGCTFQRYSSFKTATPIAAEDTLIIGFLGGRDAWDDGKVGVGRLAKRLRERDLGRVHVETVENTKRRLAVRLVERSLDRDRNGRLDDAERVSARIIVYGQSFGGAAVVKFARQLHQRDIPILLTVQVDSVGLNDEVIPPNVRNAANLYQRTGRIIRGAPQIRPADRSRTRIILNRRYDYRGKKVSLAHLAWYKRAFRNDHVKMDQDPEVWAEVERLIVAAAASP